MRLLCFIFPLLLILSSCATAVEILTPENNAVVNSGKLYLIFTATDGARVVVKRGIEAKFLFVKKENKVAVYHYLLMLKKGRNLFYIDPEGKALRLIYKQKNSTISFKFHRKKIEKRCNKCHSLKASGKLCFNCHKFKKGSRIYMHGPFAKRECFSCHSPGYVKGVRFGLKGNSDFSLCSQCHFAPLVWRKMLYQHGPFAARNCTACHDPHEGNFRFLLKYEPKKGLCLACHRDKAKEFSSEGYRFHPILSAKGCVICHDPHASDYPKQLYDTPFKVCISCHPRFGKIKKGHPIVAHPVVGPLIPGTNEKLTCSSCHNPHGSPYESLLYAPRAGSRVCLKCHKY